MEWQLATDGQRFAIAKEIEKYTRHRRLVVLGLLLGVFAFLLFYIFLARGPSKPWEPQAESGRSVFAESRYRQRMEEYLEERERYVKSVIPLALFLAVGFGAAGVLYERYLRRLLSDAQGDPLYYAAGRCIGKFYTKHVRRITVRFASGADREIHVGAYFLDRCEADDEVLLLSKDGKEAMEYIALPCPWQPRREPVQKDPGFWNS